MNDELNGGNDERGNACHGRYPVTPQRDTTGAMVSFCNLIVRRSQIVVRRSH